jgi:hypothetical protein
MALTRNDYIPFSSGRQQSQVMNSKKEKSCPIKGQHRRSQMLEIVADDEQNFLHLKFTCHREITTNTKKIHKVFAYKGNTDE